MDFTNLIGIIIVLGIVYILYEKGYIRNVRFPVIRHKFVFDHSSTKGTLRLSYGKYNGGNNYLFSLKPGQQTELHYDVEVEEGSVVLSIKMGKEIIIDKEFKESEKGKVSFVPQKSKYILAVMGKNTKGGCRIQFQPAAETAEEPVNS
ncbi:hypothetical protein [Virgibacillus sp. YIM 98842]|uniref:hypothetical protein n=1 Tax=Virgibacillus sp. YIM 98842 TaxID=2663533 RepID=UPI0013DC30A9|nr:hypothetical protein [Virgibacillus sp. YIM 98842]